MTTFVIKDLPVAEEMDSEAMAAVRGGMTYGEAFKQLQQAAAGECAVVDDRLFCLGTVTPVK